MAEERPRPVIRGNAGALVVLVLASIVTAAFFVSVFGVNARGLGRHDLGMAIALAYLYPLTVYTSMPIVVVAIIGAIGARMRNRSIRLWLVIAAVALLPITCLMLDVGPSPP